MNIPTIISSFPAGRSSYAVAMVPLNLKKNGRADYLVAGQWGKKAAGEARKFVSVNVVLHQKTRHSAMCQKLINQCLTPMQTIFISPPIIPSMAHVFVTRI